MALAEPGCPHRLPVYCRGGRKSSFRLVGIAEARLAVRQTPGARPVCSPGRCNRAERPAGRRWASEQLSNAFVLDRFNVVGQGHYREFREAAQPEDLVPMGERDAAVAYCDDEIDMIAVCQELL